MRHLAAAVGLLVLLGTLASAQGTDAPQPDQPGLLKGKEDRFTLKLPEGWQSVLYEKPQDKMNAKLIFEAAKFGDAMKSTDNINLWWYQGPESLMQGIASFHRFELPQDTDVKSVLAWAETSKSLPPGLKLEPKQLGKYVGILGGTVAQNVFYVAIVLIPQGKVTYMATIIGTPTSIPAQWTPFMQMVMSLTATDLKPNKLEEVMAEPAEPAPATGDKPAAAAKPEPK